MMGVRAKGYPEAIRDNFTEEVASELRPLNELLPRRQSRGGCSRQKLASAKTLGHN